MAAGTVVDREQRIVDLRARIVNKIVGGSVMSVEAMWDLAIVKSESAWRSWKRTDGTLFEYFSDWADYDLGAYYSQSYLSQLASCGCTFWPYRQIVNEQVKKGKVGIRRLRGLHLRHLNGTPIGEVMTSVETGQPLADELKEEAKPSTEKSWVDPEQLVPMLDVALVKSGDMLKAQVGITLACIRGGYSRYFEAFQDWLINESENHELPSARYEKWLTHIMEGKFICRKCGLVPIPPDEHHVIPRSAGGEGGPTVLLCSACHNAVQPEWRQWSERWYGKKKTDEMVKEFAKGGK